MIQNKAALNEDNEFRPLLLHQMLDGAHDCLHIERVLAIAFQIATEVAEVVDERILHAACWLHDLVPIDKFSSERRLASSRSAKSAREHLKSVGWTDHDAKAVSHAIEAHSFSAGIAPTSIEAKILRDADHLDAMGMIGLARMFYVAGSAGSQLYAQADPMAMSRPLDDHRYALDHYKTKLIHLEQRIITAPGRKMARDRLATMALCVDALSNEIGAKRDL